MNTGRLLKDVFRTFMYENKSFINTKSVGIAISFVLNVLSTLHSFSALELIRCLTNLRVDSTRDVAASKYIRHALLGILYKCTHKALFSYFCESTVGSLSVRLLREAMEMEHKDIVRSDAGEIITNIQNKISIYKSLFDVLTFRLASILLFVGLSFMKIVNTKMPILYCITLLYPIVYLTVGVVRLRGVFRFHKLYLDQKIANSSVLYDKIQNFELIKSHGIESRQCDEFYNTIDTQRKAFFQMKLEGEKRNLILEGLSEMPFLVIILIAAFTESGSATGLTIAFMIFRSLNGLLRETSELISSLGILLNSANGILDLSVRKRANLTAEFKSSIRYRSVNVYHGTNKILSGVNLKIGKNDRIAVVGKNGTGKSTFVKTLLRFSVYDGEISIDDYNINDISSASMASLIGYVSQDDYISDTTVEDNIKMGNRDISLDQIVKMAKQLGIHNDIMSLRHGYNTRAGVKGANLSAGQRKKICMFRAFVKCSPILVLDEATSGIDKGYERYIVKDILKKAKNKTVIMIIHQKELVKHFKKVIFLANGKVEDYGEFSKVYRRSEAFRRFMSEAKS